MNNANGGTVTYHFKGNTEDLENKLSGIKSILGKGAKLGGAMLGAVATASTVAGAVVSGSTVGATSEITSSIFAPHSGQNLVFSATSRLQLGHFISFSP